MAANDCLACNGRLFITDKQTKIKYLIDTGSDLCVFPRTATKDRRLKSEYELYAANNTVINTYGYITLDLDLGLRRNFKWRFVVADVTKPIIGVDFLSHYNLLVDCRHHRLADGLTELSVAALHCNETSKEAIAIKAVKGETPYHELLKQYPELTRPSGTPLEPKHKTRHFIRTTPGPPTAARPRRLDPDRLKVAKKEFEDMLLNGTARRSDSPWSSPLHLAKKKDDGWRPCGDYRALNARTIPDCYPIRHLQDFAYQLAGSRVFSKIDLIKAYNQIPVNPQDVPKTAITTPFGLFEFEYMTFGLRNAAQTFQRFIDEVLQGLDFTFGYLDDILVFSKSPEENLQHLKVLFDRLKSYGILINTSKCVFGVSEVTFLGYHVSKEGIRPLSEKVVAIQDYPVPKTAKQLRRFLGMLNYYRRFIPHAAEIQGPLNDALAGNRKGSTPINMTEELLRSFQDCKSSLSKAALLSHPNSQAELALFTDASDEAIGAVIQQRENNIWTPLGFFSRKLSSSQKKYSPYDRELLAIYEGIRYFRYMLEARSFAIFTDHKPITFAFKTKRDNCSPRQFRYLDLISQYTTDIRHIAGRDNIVADALSRIEEIGPAINYSELARDQAQDPELQDLIRNGSSLKLQKLETCEELYCDFTTTTPRPYVTPKFRKQVFSSIHGLSHPGKNATANLVAQKYVWPGIRKDCRTWVQQCIDCQRCKITRHSSSPLSIFPTPTQRFSHVHLDLIGPLPYSSGFRYCLTAVDRFTRWPEAYPLADITAETCAAAFVSGWVARFGCPHTITTDRGQQFQSQLFHGIMKLIGAKHSPTTAYHPQSNGMVERMHRQLKTAITCHNNPQWTESLPLVLLGIRSSWKEDLKTSSAELVYGEPLRLPGEFFTPARDLSLNMPDFTNRLREHMARLSPTPASHHKSKTFYLPKDIFTAEYVFLRRGPAKRTFEAPYTGPYKVLEQSKDGKTLKIDVQGKSCIVSVDRLKPAYLALTHDEPEITKPETTEPAAATPPPKAASSAPPERKTRSGRVVHFPDYYRP